LVGSKSGCAWAGTAPRCPPRRSLRGRSRPLSPRPRRHQVRHGAGGEGCRGARSLSTRYGAGGAVAAGAAVSAGCREGAALQRGRLARVGPLGPAVCQYLLGRLRAPLSRPVSPGRLRAAWCTGGQTDRAVSAGGPRPASAARRLGCERRCWQAAAGLPGEREPGVTGPAPRREHAGDSERVSSARTLQRGSLISCAALNRVDRDDK